MNRGTDANCVVTVDVEGVEEALGVVEWRGGTSFRFLLLVESGGMTGAFGGRKR